jgi:hypothetical protein
MKNFLVSLLFSFSLTALFIPCDLSALKNKNSDNITPEEQAALNAKLLRTARHNRFKSALELVELGADLDARNEQKKSPREMLEEALRQPESPLATHQQEFTFERGLPSALCCASCKAVNGREIESFLRKREIRNKLLVLVNQKKQTRNQASPTEHAVPGLSIDTTVSPVVSKPNQLSPCPTTPTSPSNPLYRPALCCAAHRAVRNTH